MSNIIHVIPEAVGDEALYLSKITDGMNQEQLANFLMHIVQEEKIPRLFY